MPIRCVLACHRQTTTDSKCARSCSQNEKERPHLTYPQVASLASDPPMCRLQGVSALNKIWQFVKFTITP